jgi:putative sugar O-methyltransferase
VPVTPATGLPDLEAMVAEMEQAPEIVRPSAYWEFLNDLNLAQLADSGFARFKRTVNQNYFNWPTRHLRDEQFRAVARDWLRRPTPRVLSARLHDAGAIEVGADRQEMLQSRSSRFAYALYVALFWERVRRVDRLGLLDTLEEPDLGDPVSVMYRGRRISQDLCNSVLEFYSVVDALSPGTLEGRRILELGPGYGRVAWVYLTAVPSCRYFLCDIPPALAVAQEYLTRLFPGRRIFRFRHFDSPAEIAAELVDAEIAFLTPNQLDLIDPVGAELFVNISSLHEMRPAQIAHYIDEVAKHCAPGGYFYSKQWIRSLNPHDDLVIEREDYPIPPEWDRIYDRRHPVQRPFFEALYRLPR